ncbi:ninein-like protein isoform X3 [Phycodurus eques]|uniref:ninein-like protein isoform X3 n=1 Tax=Phycodurus eques TaxID=693459 RepID=UPI002ACE4B6B|nr:ninein-like protein isoform X3 [Phycodurus eques]
MEEAEPSRYVAQLKAEFDSCDATSSGFLGPREVTAPCGKLHLDVELPLVLDSLLGGGAYARVDFEAFKDNFVDVLSRSLDSTADDDSGYLQPVVADEVKPKFVKGGKRYGRRSRPDIKPPRPSDDSPPPRTGDTARSSPGGARGPKARRSTCPDIVETLDFPAEERVSLRELTSALDNELTVSGNRIHRVALICYKNEIRHLRARAEEARGERDKAGADLERAERRNLRLVREADERHAGMEELNRTAIRKLERDFRERLAAQRGQAELESADAVQRLEQERQKLQQQLRMLRAQEAGLQEELSGAAQENRRLREELVDAKRRFNEAESGARRLHADFNRLLHHKLSSSDAVDSAEDKLARLLRDYEHQCGELRDKNDELSSELELMRSREKSDRKSAHAAAAAAAAELCWSEATSASDFDSDDCDTMRRLSATEPDDATAAVSVETELAVAKLKREHEREMRRLDIQTETQVNYYKCGLDRMRQSTEAEREAVAQAFKLEISELEDQKVEAERQAKLLKEALDKLHNRIQHGGRSADSERRMRRERADSERNFAREMGNLVRRLSAEEQQLEAELKLKMDREVMVLSGGLKSRCGSAPKVSVASPVCRSRSRDGSDRGNRRGWSGRRKRWRKRNISRRKRGGRSRRRVSRGSRSAPYRPEEAPRAFEREVRPEENVSRDEFDREGTAQPRELRRLGPEARAEGAGPEGECRSAAASGGSAPDRTGGYVKTADQLSARIAEMANAASGPSSGTSGR